MLALVRVVNRNDGWQRPTRAQRNANTFNLRVAFAVVGIVKELKWIHFADVDPLFSPASKIAACGVGIPHVVLGRPMIVVGRLVVEFVETSPYITHCGHRYSLLRTGKRE